MLVFVYTRLFVFAFLPVVATESFLWVRTVKTMILTPFTMSCTDSSSNSLNLIFFQLIEQEAVELKNKFSNPRRSMLEDSYSGQLEDIDVIPNEEMLLVITLLISDGFVILFLL